jgi:hypothetical protein
VAFEDNPVVGVIVDLLILSFWIGLILGVWRILRGG